MKVKVNQSGSRLDVYVAHHLNISRSKALKLIKEENILVNDKKTKGGYILCLNDEITINSVETNTDIKPEKMDLDIVYEDDDVIVVNKPNGMVVHPAPGNYNGTLVNGLMAYSDSLSNVNGEFRPGIVHRIDAYTTGLLMIAKNDKAHDFLAKQLVEKTTYRKYIALVWGTIKEDTGLIDAPIGRDKHDRKKMAVVADGKKAITNFKVLKRYKNATLLELKLETGRTHQIRVHLNYIGHPVVNDKVYGNRKIIDETGQCLHAKELGFIHPKTKKYMEFTSDLPSSFINILSEFEEVWKEE